MGWNGMNYPVAAPGRRRSRALVSPRRRAGERRRAGQPRVQDQDDERVPQDNAEAMRWHRLAADQGDPPALSEEIRVTSLTH